MEGMCADTYIPEVFLGILVVKLFVDATTVADADESFGWPTVLATVLIDIFHSFSIVDDLENNWLG